MPDCTRQQRNNTTSTMQDQPLGARASSGELSLVAELLRAMKLSGCVFLEGEFTAPWCVESRITPEDCPLRMPESAHMIAYHYVVEGDFLLQLDQKPPVAAQQGQLLLLPRNDPHLLTSSSDLDPVDNAALIKIDACDGIGRLRHGGGGSRAHLLCGYLGTNDASDPLLMSLPSLIQLDLRNTSTAIWIEGSIRHAMRESSGDDHAAISSLTKLAEVLFAEAIRTYLKDLPDSKSGRLACLRDPVAARALALIHGSLDRPWTLECIAREVGASRSSLTDKFMRFVGASPMQYLRRRRLVRASDELSNKRRTISEIAFEAGYDSEAAFSRAFKRAFGASPSTYREAQTGMAAVSTSSGAEVAA